jgi:predicted acyltransferase
VGQWYRWGTFWKVIGANSIVAYVMSWTLEEPIKMAVERHFGWLLDIAARDTAQPLLLGAIVLVIFWIILKWLDRQKIYVRI